MALRIRLSSRTREPRALQIRAQILEYLRKEGLQEGDRLPSERDLAERFGLNVNTVSKAYRLLVSEGYLSRAVGRGTFLSTRCLRGTVALLRLHDQFSPGSLFGRLAFEALASRLNLDGFRSEVFDIPYGQPEALSRQIRFMQGARQGAWSAVAMSSFDLPDEVSLLLQKRGIPVLALDPRRLPAHCDGYLYIDYADFFRKAVAELRRTASRNPVYVGLSTVHVNGDFAATLPHVRQLLAKEGIPLPDARVFCAGHFALGEQDFKVMENFLEKAAPFDSILCDNDIAMELIQLVLLKRGSGQNPPCIVTHVNRAVSRLLVVPHRPLCIDIDDFAARACALLASLMEPGRTGAVIPNPVPFSE